MKKIYKPEGPTHIKKTVYGVIDEMILKNKIINVARNPSQIRTVIFTRKSK